MCLETRDPLDSNLIAHELIAGLVIPRLFRSRWGGEVL
jgi:hypothetical protein